MTELAAPEHEADVDLSADIVEWFHDRPRSTRPIVFLDRDGVINEHREGGYVLTIEEFQIIPDVLHCLKRLSAGGRDIVVVTNQSCINRGLLPVATLRSIMDGMVATFNAAGISCIAWLCCPHRPDEKCRCRKPGTAMLERAAEITGAKLTNCVVVGDSASDIAAARRVGSDSFFVQRNSQWALSPIVDRILEARIC